MYRGLFYILQIVELLLMCVSMNLFHWCRLYGWYGICDEDVRNIHLKDKCFPILLYRHPFLCVGRGGHYYINNPVFLRKS